MNSACDFYLTSVLNSFPSFTKNEQAYYDYFSSSVMDYVATAPFCTTEDLISEFGTPEDIITSYYDDEISEMHTSAIHTTRNYIICASIISIIVLLSLGYLYYSFYITPLNIQFKDIPSIICDNN